MVTGHTAREIPDDKVTVPRTMAKGMAMTQSTLTPMSICLLEADILYFDGRFLRISNQLVVDI